ncbi:hypothetical protein HG530_007097 [Fusarium avenaceum]|nr:hypothetical protein HG530_007097 [Fusarium avenaceum]
MSSMMQNVSGGHDDAQAAHHGRVRHAEADHERRHDKVRLAEDEVHRVEIPASRVLERPICIPLQRKTQTPEAVFSARYEAEHGGDDGEHGAGPKIGEIGDAEVENNRNERAFCQDEQPEQKDHELVFAQKDFNSLGRSTGEIKTRGGIAGIALDAHRLNKIIIRPRRTRRLSIQRAILSRHYKQHRSALGLLQCADLPGSTNTITHRHLQVHEDEPNLGTARSLLLGEDVDGLLAVDSAEEGFGKAPQSSCVGADDGSMKQRRELGSKGQTQSSACGMLPDLFVQIENAALVIWVDATSRVLHVNRERTVILSIRQCDRHNTLGSVLNGVEDKREDAVAEEIDVKAKTVPFGGRFVMKEDRGFAEDAVDGCSQLVGYTPEKILLRPHDIVQQTLLPALGELGGACVDKPRINVVEYPPEVFRCYHEC